MSVLVVGEALIDLLVRDHDLHTVTAVPGGGPYNCARTIGRLGFPVTFAGGLAEDAWGIDMARRLAADGVEICLPPRPDLLSTIALASLDAGGAATYRFYFAGTAAPSVTESELVCPPGTAAVSVGTLGLVLEPLASATEGFVARLDSDVLLMVDPNCRPAVITDRDHYLARLERVLARANVVKVSGDDVEYLFPGTDKLVAAETLLEWGAGLVLLTDGPEAVHIVHGSGTRSLPVPAVEVVDSVGSGDAFAGGFLAKWLHADRPALTDLDVITPLVRDAITVASLTCQRAGANPPLRHEVADLFS